MLTWCAILIFATPLFTEDTGRLGTQPDCNSNPGCWTNYALLADLDGADGLDILFPNADGYFTQGNAEPFVVLMNDGSGNFSDTSATAVGGYSGWLRQVAAGDIDGDGDLDLIAPAAWNDPIAVFMNDGTGAFTDESATRIGGATSQAGSARLGDVDDDGDLDLLIGEWVAGNEVHLYLNDGTGVFVEAPTQVPTVGSIGNADLVDLDLFDADNDFDLDLMLNMHAEDAVFWLNDGKGTFTKAPTQMPAHTSGFTYNPAACDVDGDGDLDVWKDNARSPQVEQLIINDGSGTFTDETATRVTNNPSADDNGVICADVDGDGDFDAVIPSLSNNERVLINDGTGNFDGVTDAFPTIGDSTLWLVLADLDGDQRMDAVTGQGESGAFLNRFYLGNANVPVDTRAPVFRQVETIPNVALNTPVVFHFAVSDDIVTDTGPLLSSVTAVADGVPYAARFMGGDLFRVELPGVSTEKTVTVQACATDAAGNNACSPEATYTVSGTGPTPTPTPTPGGGGNPDEPGNCRCAAAPAAPHGAVASLALVLLALVRISVVVRRRRRAR